MIRPPFAHRHAGKPALRDFVPIRRLAPGTRFRFRSPAWAGGPQPVHGPVGVVVGPGNAGGVLVELESRTGETRRRRERAEWSGAVYVLPEPGAWAALAPGGLER